MKQVVFAMYATSKVSNLEHIFANTVQMTKRNGTELGDMPTAGLTQQTSASTNSAGLTHPLATSSGRGTEDSTR